MRTILKLLIAATVLSAFPTESRAIDATFGSWVNQVQAEGLKDFAGKTLVAFFVSGREAVINGQGQALHLAAVKTDPVRVTIAADGTAVIAKTFVPQTGLRAFNYLVFAIPTTDNQGFYLKNFDGTYPSDPRVPASEWSHLENQDFAYERLWYISTLELKALQFSQGQSDTVSLDFNSRAVTTSAVSLKASAPRHVIKTSHRL